MFAPGPQADLARQVLQHRDGLGGGQVDKDLPVLRWNRDQHPPMHFRNFIGQIVPGEVLIDSFFSVDAAQRRKNDGQGVVGPYSNFQVPAA
jgi:hypothetical protein